MNRLLIAVFVLTLFFTGARLLKAQSDNGALVVSACGTLPKQFAVGATRQLTVNTSGQVCQ